MLGLSKTAAPFIATFRPGIIASHRRASVGTPTRTDRNVDLAPGQQLYVKVVSLESWGSGLAGTKNIRRDAFYAWLIPPEVAQPEIARDRSGI